MTKRKRQLKFNDLARHRVPNALNGACVIEALKALVFWVV
jgi:hypothetical protein